ncbi:MAG: DUF2335 domain-containing protein [Acidobacteriota bacterium]
MRLPRQSWCQQLAKRRNKGFANRTQIQPRPQAVNPPPAQRTVSLTASASFHSGPLPAPSTLAEYERVFPGCAERIVAMAEKQSAHRQDLERTVVRGNVNAERRGQICAFVLGAIAIGGGIYLIATGKDVQGLVAILGALGALAGVFVYGRRRQEKEREKKRQEVENPQLPIPFDPPASN